MQDSDNVERSADLLRTILPLMTRRAAGYTPLNYAFWYAYVRGDAGELRAEVDALTGGERRLNMAETQRLYRVHVADQAERALFEARSRLSELMGEVRDAAGQAGQRTTHFDANLSAFERNLSNATSVEDLGHQVAEMAADVRLLGRSLRELNEHLEHSQGEVRRLGDQMQQLRDEARIDPLSGLLNRRGFDHELARIQDLLASNGGGPEAGEASASVAVVMIDIDHFKKINDTLGHPFGDRVIAAVGSAIRGQLDLGQQQVAARYGGEEFAVITPARDITAPGELAERIRRSIESGRIRSTDGTQRGGSVTVSAGVACRRAGESLDSLLARADAALYASKHAGRNRVTRAA